MFTTERYSLQNGAKHVENRDWPAGMRLVNSRPVKRGLTYRSIVLAFGIGVALIVLLTFWASRRQTPLAVTRPIASFMSQAADVSFFKDLLKKSEINF